MGTIDVTIHYQHGQFWYTPPSSSPHKGFVGDKVHWHSPDTEFTIGYRNGSPWAGQNVSYSSMNKHVWTTPTDTTGTFKYDVGAQGHTDDPDMQIDEGFKGKILRLTEQITSAPVLIGAGAALVGLGVYRLCRCRESREVTCR